MTRSRSVAPLLIALALLAQLLLAGATSARDRRAPAPRSLPRISGTPLMGHTLKASHGRWKNHPTRFHFRWLVCNGAGKKCQKVAGHGATYRLGARAVRHRVRVVVRASNRFGAAQAMSSATRSVGEETAPPPPPRPPPAGIRPPIVSRIARNVVCMWRT